MILNRLTLCNFRAYAGVHHVDLTPRTKYGAVRPIILVGGLNGSGKTTLLMALKLALYGRHAVGMGTSTAAYSQFIRECIHTAPTAAVKPRCASVELDFTYGKLGRLYRYVVRRHWQDVGREIREELTLKQEDGGEQSLSTAECQGFLNELVPIGVSDLFFFDGEKIADLAEDDTGRALGDALHRLFGLDLVERLRSDLRVYMLRGEAKTGNRSPDKTIDDLRQSYEERKAELARHENELTIAKGKLDELVVERDRQELRLSERGGEWAQSRQMQKAEAVKLDGEIKQDERRLRTELAGMYPLVLADEVLRDALRASVADLASHKARETNEMLRRFASTFKSRLDDDAHAMVDDVLTEMLEPESEITTSLDLSERALGRMEGALQQEIPMARSRVLALAATLARRKHELDHITLQVGRAPDQASLSAEFSALASLNERIADARADVAVRERELKLEYSSAINLARSLRDEHNARSKRQALDRPLRYAARARLLLKDFEDVNAKQKVAHLEGEFAAALQRFMQKGIVAEARIDPRRFTVTLLDSGGGEIRKSQLSAGEKQIYAIAMLEALARMSGRRLPVIVDTPLGRLDSHHRMNLVEHYFPSASHQVVLLSTDTEVDNSFFRSLSPHVSHAYEILYDHGQSRARLRGGYFWRHRQGVVK